MSGSGAFAENGSNGIYEGMSEAIRARPERYSWDRTDLDRTTFCGQAQWCESCDGWKELKIYTVQTPTQGVYCTTLCEDCVELSDTPRLSAPEAAVRILDHCGHLGITCDDMDAILNGGGR